MQGGDDDGPAPEATPSYLLAPPAEFSGGNRVRLLRGGAQLFPAMLSAFRRAHDEIWIATYIFHHDPAALEIVDGLRAAMERGVKVRIVVDGFGSIALVKPLREALGGRRSAIAVFRPLERWWSWFQPGQMRRQHHKLCVVDGRIAFVGGINLIDDHHDVRHGWSDAPRLDFAVQLTGPIVAPILQTTRAMWTRAALGPRWRDEVVAITRSLQPVARAKRLLQRMRMSAPPAPTAEQDARPVRAAFVVRDNFRRRRGIERIYVSAIVRARRRVDIACPYFYPGRAFRRVLRLAAKRGVRVRLLLQGKVDYRIAGLAARVLYDELIAHRVEIYEYMPAYLHAKIAVVDDDWATVGSSNIDPLSLLLNLEGNVVVRDAGFCAALAAEFETAIADARRVERPSTGFGGWGLLRRGFVAWCANVYLRMAGITGRY